MVIRMRLMLVCVVLAILSITEAAVNRQYGRQRFLGHYSPQKSVIDRRGSLVSNPNPFLRQRVNLTRTQNSPPNWPHNRHLVQSPPLQNFSRQRINPQRQQNLPPAQPYNRQRIPSPSPQTYQNNGNQKHGKLNYQLVPQRQPNPQTRPLPSTLQTAARRVSSLTRNNKQGVNPRILRPPTSDRVGKQVVLPRKFIQASQNTQQTPRGRSRLRGQSNRTNRTCPNGKVWRNGGCVCPYLSNWDGAQAQCVCIYGTYRDSRGDCHNF